MPNSTVTMIMSDLLLAGPAVTAHNGGTISAVTMDQVSLSQSAGVSISRDEPGPLYFQTNTPRPQRLPCRPRRRPPVTCG